MIETRWRCSEPQCDWLRGAYKSTHLLAWGLICNGIPIKEQRTVSEWEDASDVAERSARELSELSPQEPVEEEK